MNIRRSLYRFLKTRVGKIPEGALVPRWLRGVRYALFPIEVIGNYLKYETYPRLNYITDVFELTKSIRMTREYVESLEEKEIKNG